MVIIYSARRQWADYFDEQGVKYAFYSAADAAALQQAQRDAAEALNRAEAERVSGESESDEESDEADDDKNEADLDSADNHSEDDTDEDDRYFSAEEEEEDTQDTRARILSVQELEDMFIAMSPNLRGRFVSLRHLSIRSYYSRIF